MRLRVLRHYSRGVVIRAFDNHGGPPAYHIVYDLRRLRDKHVRYEIRERLRADLKMLRETA